MDFKTSIESLPVQRGGNIERVNLLPLTSEQQTTINPIVPPTSGIRIEIYEKKGDIHVMTIPRQMMFLRIFKAVSEIAKVELKKKHPLVLLVSDDRPSASKLTEYCAKIFTFDEYKIYFQKPSNNKAKIISKQDPYYTRMSTPYASASMGLFPEIDLVVVLTASHNSLIWNGVKIYIQVPIPISGRVMEQISRKALEYTEISMAREIHPIYVDADRKNNEYILELTKKLVDISVLRKKKIVFWPYFGDAPEIQDLMQLAGVDLFLVEENIDPPNPTAILDENRIKKIMDQQKSNLSILMDADRDRVIFFIRKPQSTEIISLTPNELYTAMHNLLIKEFHQKIINVRTVPSDPRSDRLAAMNIIAGVGYKHLGMVLWAAMNKPIDPAKFSTGILYTEEGSIYKKILNPADIRREIAHRGVIGKDIIMTLWEESGGHTFNILDIAPLGTDDVKITAKFPSIGDKYPAVAILVLSTLLQMGYDLTTSVDRTIIGTRTTIEADDTKKVKIIQTFGNMKGQQFTVNDQIYTIDTFEQVDGTIDIILMYNETTKIYFRPSGTGPEVRIYIFGPATSAKTLLNAAAYKIGQMFP